MLKWKNILRRVNVIMVNSSLHNFSAFLREDVHYRYSEIRICNKSMRNDDIIFYRDGGK